MPNKPHAKEVTIRFLQEMDRVVGRNLTATAFGIKVGMTVSNINRLRSAGNTCVTVEACCLLMLHFGTDANWLMAGKQNKTDSVEDRLKRLEQILLPKNE